MVSMKFRITLRQKMQFLLSNLIRITARIRRPSEKPIVLLAHDRSGSSWLGEVLGTAPNIIYYHEPLHPRMGFNGDWKYWRNCVCDEESKAFFHALFAPIFSGEVARNGSARQSVKDLSKRLFRNYRVLVKEVGSVLAGEFFDSQYDCEIVLLIRHPVAITLSALKQQGQADNATKWQNMLLAQPKLVSTYPTLEYLKRDFRDDQLKMLAVVSAVYSILYRQFQNNRDWLLIRYEDFCIAPHHQFKKLFNSLNLSFSDRVEKKITETTSATESGIYSTKRISHRMAYKWKDEVSIELLNEMKKNI